MTSTSILGTMADIAKDSPERVDLDPGTRVEVRTGFDRSWSNGFEIHSTAEDGYRVRRRTDGHLLPATFADDDIRRERKDRMWWY